MKTAFERRKIKSSIGKAVHFLPEEKKTAVSNSLLMRIMENSRAEKEADQLSKGVTSNTPDAVMSEMGSRLGSECSCGSGTEPAE